jgi:hypothetical protein
MPSIRQGFLPVPTAVGDSSIFQTPFPSQGIESGCHLEARAQHLKYGDGARRNRTLLLMASTRDK